MSEIKDRQDAASDIDPIVAAQADDSRPHDAQADDAWAAAAVEGFAEPVDAEAIPEVDPTGLAVLVADTAEPSEAVAAEPAAAADLAVLGHPPLQSTDADFGDEAPAAAIASDDIADAIEAALLSETPALVAEPHSATTFEHMPAAYADTIVELDAASADDDAPLLDVDLEDGIASVFAALHAAREDNAAVEPSDDPEAADGVTFRLLGELDRLWHRAA